MNEMGKTILSIIPYGYANRITSTGIKEKTGFAGCVIRKNINFLRQQGYPICSDKDGYWIAADDEEIEQTIEGIEHRITSMMNAINGLRKAKKEMHT